MAVNKVDINGATVIDLTGDSVTPETLLQGATAHDASGATITGTMVRGTELKIIVSVASGATVTATKGNLSVSGTSVNGTCTLVVPEEGEWTVSATLGGETSTSNIVNVTSSYDTSLVFISTILNDNSWETIRGISDAGTGENFWSIGDRKEITLNGTVGTLTLSNYTTYAFIIGFNHNQELEGTNRIHFQLAKTALSSGTDVALCDSGYGNAFMGQFIMNSSESNDGGWESSFMRKYICGTSMISYSNTIIAVIPEALRTVLKYVTKYTNNTGRLQPGMEAATATTDYFFLLSEYEVFGTFGASNIGESKKQAQYLYYSSGNSKVKYNYSATSIAVIWWLRSPVASGSEQFVTASANGTVASDDARRSFGFAPGFCV